MLLPSSFTSGTPERHTDRFNKPNELGLIHTEYTHLMFLLGKTESSPTSVGKSEHSYVEKSLCAYVTTQKQN